MRGRDSPGIISLEAEFPVFYGSTVFLQRHLLVSSLQKQQYQVLAASDFGSISVFGCIGISTFRSYHQKKTYRYHERHGARTLRTLPNRIASHWRSSYRTLQLSICE